MIRNLIFDLDGTLVDSLPSIESSARIAVSRALPELPAPDLRSVVGPPIAMMFAKLWPDLPTARMTALLAEFRSIYDSTGCLDAIPYPGVLPLLTQWSAQGMRLFVLTNKPEKPTRSLLQHHGLISLFTEIRCPDSAIPFKAKPLAAAMLAKTHGLRPESTALVGDGSDDAEAALHCGFPFFHASYGYGAPPNAQSFTPLREFASLEHILNPIFAP